MTVASEPKRSDGQPYDTEITPSMRKWFCRGGADPERLMAQGMKLEWLLLLWNLRAEKRECGYE